MSLPHRESEDGAERPLTESERSRVKPNRDVDDAMFEQVLRETLLAEDGGELSTAEVRALTEVARRHEDSPLCSEPIAAELVRSLLVVRFGDLMRSPEWGQEVSRRIASTLIGDPQEQLFLQRFWDRLREATA